MLRYAADVDIIEAETCHAVGLPMPPVHEPNYRGCYAITVLHARHDGTFQELRIDPRFEAQHVVERDLWAAPGHRVTRFTGANQSLGTLFLRFDSVTEADVALQDTDKYFQIITSD